MKTFLTQLHYSEEPELTIHLYGRCEDGKSAEVQITGIKPFFYVRESDKEKFTELTGVKTIDTQKQTLQHEKVVKVEVRIPKEVPILRKLAEEHDIACFEADILFTQRYLMEKNILGAFDVNGDPQKGTHTDLLYKNPVISATTTETRPTMLSFDIETDSRAREVYSISLYDGTHNEVLVVRNSAFKESYKDTTIVDTEEEVLKLFFERLKSLDPDILVGWNSIDFDLKVIQQRAKNYGIPFRLGRVDDESTMRVESSFLKDSTVQAKGRLILDGIQILKWSFVKLDDYKLNTASKEILGEAKTIQEDDRWQIIEDYYRSEPEKFIEYNRKDSVLVYDILHESKSYELSCQRCFLTGMTMDRIKASIASFDSLYIRELNKRGYVAPTTRPQNTEAGLGGYVLKSTPGIYTNIVVLDFKSLYPSIMRTFNIDPLAYRGIKEEVKGYSDPTKFIVAPNDSVFSQEEGILTDILATLWKARDEAKADGNELARFAIKILMNSMYGVLASQNSRFHIRNLSNAITYFGQEIIKLTVNKLAEKGFHVIYGDTDSVFVDIKTEDTHATEKIAQQLEVELNEYFTKYVEDTYKRESILQLEFEKVFTNFILPKVRGSDEGAKKRYAGRKLIGWEGDEPQTKLDFTGLEFVRRDWTQIAKTFQLQLLDLVFSGKEVDKYIKTFVEDVRNKKYDDQLVYRKALRKKLESYTKTTPPHVKAAQLLDKITNNIIDYYITLDGPQPIQKMTSQIDYDHYIEKQIRPIAESILNLENKHFDDVIKGTKQKGLDAFFG